MENELDKRIIKALSEIEVESNQGGKIKIAEVDESALKIIREAALGALPEELVYAKDMTYSEEMVLSYNHALSAAKLKIEKLKK